MNPIVLTEEQIKRLILLASEVAPHFVVRAHYHTFNLPPDETGMWKTKGIVEWNVLDQHNVEYYPWLEFCFTHLVKYIAKKYAEHHKECTTKWAEYMILQKIAFEVEKNSPIDTLYEIWENPSKYAQGL